MIPGCGLSTQSGSAPLDWERSETPGEHSYLSGGSRAPLNGSETTACDQAKQGHYLTAVNEDGNVQQQIDGPFSVTPGHAKSPGTSTRSSWHLPIDPPEN